MIRYLDQVPGFRSRSVWRAALAVGLYVWAAVLIVRGAAHGWWGTVLLGIVLFVILASSSLGVRSRIPLLNSRSKISSSIGWIALVGIALIMFAIVPNADTSHSSAAATAGDNLGTVAGSAWGLMFNNLVILIPVYVVVTAAVLLVFRRSASGASPV